VLVEVERVIDRIEPQLTTCAAAAAEEELGTAQEANNGMDVCEDIRKAGKVEISEVALRPVKGLKRHLSFAAPSTPSEVLNDERLV